MTVFDRIDCIMVCMPKHSGIRQRHGDRFHISMDFDTNHLLEAIMGY